MKRTALFLILAGCASSPPPPENEPQDAPAAKPIAAAPEVKTLKRAVIVLSRRAGSSVTTIRGDQIEYAYEHLDNGRGPKVEAKARVAPDGTLISFDATGHKTMGTSIDEHFAIENGVAKWKSPEEAGEQAVNGPAFFVPLAPLPEIVSQLFAAMQKSGGKIALLPGGEARVERTREAVVKNAAGQEKKLVGWVLFGLDLIPIRFWTAEDGTFFGLVDSWYSCLEEGWEAAIEPLVAIQREMDSERDRTLVEKLGHAIPEAGLAITNARVLDVKKGKWLPEHTVVIAGGKIKAIGPSKKIKAPAGAEVLDAQGKALLPGLWDMHQHLGQADGILDIASGVTTARDLGNDPDRLDDLKKRFDEKSAIGPRVLRSGFIEGRGDKAAGSKITAETEEEAKTAVEFYHQRGYEGIKIYNSMKPELVPVLARLAHEKGMRVSGHVPVHMLAEDVVKAGYDEIQHVNMLFLNFVADRTVDTRTPLRFSLVADKGADVDLKSKPVQDFVKLLLAKKIAVDPTVNAFQDLFEARQGAVTADLVPTVERLPLQVQRYFKTGGLPVPEGKDEQYLKSYQRMLEMIKMLHAKKVPMVAGTDNIAGLMLHHELSLYARAGIANADILRIATIDAARLMKMDKTTGSIDVGKTADVFLVDGDPLAKIDDVGRVVTTIRGDMSYASAALYPEVGVRPIQ